MKNINIIKPNTSEGSQFHQPPHEPSCKAHHPPKARVIKRVKPAHIKFLNNLISDC